MGSVVKNCVPRNEEFSFLYKKLKVIPPIIISEFGTIPEFMDVLRSYKGSITDEVIYELFKETYKEMIKDGKKSRTATNVMNKVSRAVTGSASTWRNSV